MSIETAAFAFIEQITNTEDSDKIARQFRGSEFARAGG